MSVAEKMTAIADKIRGLLGIEELLTLDDMPDKIGEVDEQAWQVGITDGYSNGFADGYVEGESAGFSNGMAEGFAQGEQAEYDRFWDVLQHNGGRVAYEYGFYRWGTADSFYPKYDIVPTNMMSFMQYFNHGVNGGEPLDLAARLEECGVRLDTSNVKNMSLAFYWTTGLKRLPAIDLSSCTNATTLFATCDNLETIDKIILPDIDTQVSLATAFFSSNKIKNITFEGVIRKSINLQNCPLTLESALSVVNHLHNYTGEDGSDTYTITFSSYVWSLLDAWVRKQPVLGELYSTAREWISIELCWLTA